MNLPKDTVEQLADRVVRLERQLQLVREECANQHARNAELTRRVQVIESVLPPLPEEDGKLSYDEGKN